MTAGLGYNSGVTHLLLHMSSTTPDIILPLILFLRHRDSLCTSSKVLHVLNLCLDLLGLDKSSAGTTVFRWIGGTMMTTLKGATDVKLRLIGGWFFINLSLMFALSQFKHSNSLQRCQNGLMGQWTLSMNNLFALVQYM